MQIIRIIIYTIVISLVITFLTPVVKAENENIIQIINNK